MQAKAFVIALFYFISSVGYGLEVHYCLGSISDVSYFLFDADCPCDASHDSNDKVKATCCEDRVFFNQLDEVYSSPATVVLSEVWLPVAEIGYTSLAERFESSTLLINAVDRGPPSVLDRVITYHKLILYG